MYSTWLGLCLCLTLRAARAEERPVSLGPRACADDADFADDRGWPCAALEYCADPLESAAATAARRQACPKACGLCGPTRIVEDEGFFEFFPTYGGGGRRLAKRVRNHVAAAGFLVVAIFAAIGFCLVCAALHRQCFGRNGSKMFIYWKQEDGRPKAPSRTEDDAAIVEEPSAEGVEAALDAPRVPAESEAASKAVSKKADVEAALVPRAAGDVEAALVPRVSDVEAAPIAAGDVGALRPAAVEASVLSAEALVRMSSMAGVAVNKDLKITSTSPSFAQILSGGNGRGKFVHSHVAALPFASQEQRKGLLDALQQAIHFKRGSVHLCVFRVASSRLAAIQFDVVPHCRGAPGAILLGVPLDAQQRRVFAHQVMAQACFDDDDETASQTTDQRGVVDDVQDDVGSATRAALAFAVSDFFSEDESCYLPPGCAERYHAAQCAPGYAAQLFELRKPQPPPQDLESSDDFACNAAASRDGETPANTPPTPHTILKPLTPYAILEPPRTPPQKFRDMPRTPTRTLPPLQNVYY
ncbi:hypothetical protein M885DRAFT_521911 [Pelagophyceae sp. CCMP2097]|nr:hypothetical protein M885DRAFT_521911 [Pelagophyceae sp. CCMP2097]